jgi:hypothetical protein
LSAILRSFPALPAWVFFSFGNENRTRGLAGALPLAGTSPAGKESSLGGMMPYRGGTGKKISGAGPRLPEDVGVINGKG